MKFNEDNGKAAGIVKVQAHKFWHFSSNGFWKNIGCIVLAPTFGLEESRLWEKEEEQNISGNKIKRLYIRSKVDLYEVFISYFIYCIMYYVCGTGHRSVSYAE